MAERDLILNYVLIATILIGISLNSVAGRIVLKHIYMRQASIFFYKIYVCSTILGICFAGVNYFARMYFFDSIHYIEIDFLTNVAMTHALNSVNSMALDLYIQMSMFNRSRSRTLYTLANLFDISNSVGSNLLRLKYIWSFNFLFKSHVDSQSY